MVRNINILILSFFLIPSTHGEEERGLPPTAERVIDRYDRQVERIARKYQDELADIREEALRDLRRELEKTTKRGDLDGAIAIRERIEELDAQSNDGDEGMRKNLLERKVLPPFVNKTFRKGKWEVAFDEEGAVRTNWPKKVERKGIWKIEDGRLIFIFDGTVVHRADFEEDRFMIDGEEAYYIAEEGEDE